MRNIYQIVSIEIKELLVWLGGVICFRYGRMVSLSLPMADC